MAKPIDRACPKASVGIHSINSFALYAPDIPAMTSFLDAFGLRVQNNDGALTVRATGSEHVWARILPGRHKKLAYLSFGCFLDDFERLRQQAANAGAEFIAPPPGGDSDGFWIADPDGIPVQVKVAPNLSPPTKRPHLSMEVPEGEQGASFRSQVQKVGPTRLAHLALFVSDFHRSLQFYMSALGLYLADMSDGIIGFTYARHGCDHHLVAMVQSQGGGLHHCSWEVPGVEYIGLIGQQVRKAGFTNQWGIGRHVLGSNWFNYIEAPGGGWWESSFNIDYIPKGMPWPAQDHDPEDSFYLWGPDLAPRLLDYSEAEPA